MKKRITSMLIIIITMSILFSVIASGEEYQDVINDQIKEGDTKAYVLDKYSYEITVKDITIADKLENRKAKISVNGEDSELLATGEIYTLEYNPIFENITLSLNGISKVNQEYYAIFELKHNKKSTSYFGMGIDNSATVSDVTKFTNIVFRLQDKGYERPNATFMFNEINAKDLKYKITLAFYSDEAIIIEGEKLTQTQILFSKELQKVLVNLNVNYRTLSSNDVTSDMLIDLFEIEYKEVKEDNITTNKEENNKEEKENREEEIKRPCIMPLCEPVYESGEYYSNGCPIYKCGEPEINDKDNDMNDDKDNDKGSQGIIDEEEIKNAPKDNTWGKFISWLKNIF